MAPIGPRRVLIIDDNVSLAENIAEILQLEGHLTEVAANGEEAMSKALPGRLDVVVTDYRLPDTNGAALLRQLRDSGFQVRAIVISAYTDEQTIADARSAGAVFVAKPVDFTVLGRAIADREETA
jgi:DNA-binding NtrC family response regulator